MTGLSSERDRIERWREQNHHQQRAARRQSMNNSEASIGSNAMTNPADAGCDHPRSGTAPQGPGHKQSPHYKKKYGAWAGNPEGRAPDYALCCEEVWTRERWARHHQCSKKRGYGPDGAYCKQHDPATVKARSDAVDARYREKWNKGRYEIYGRTFFDVLLKIAEGHNNARGLAQEAIDSFKAGEMHSSSQ